MTVPQKVKEALATLYDYPEFKALDKWNELHITECARQIIGIDMSQNGASEKVALLQGQANAHRFMLLELRKIHKDVVKD